MSAQARGVVVILQGNAWVVSPDGSKRAIKLGDEIQEGQIVLTEDGTRLELALPNGREISLESGRELLIDANLLGFAPEDATNAALKDLNSSPAAIARVIASGGDLSAELDPTAAGLSGGDASDSHSFVRVIRINETVTPLSIDRAADSSSEEFPPFGTQLTAAPAPTVSSVSSPTQTEGNTLVYSVSLSASTITSTTYSFSLGSGTATSSDYGTPIFSNGVSYDSATGTVTVPSGVSNFTVSIAAIDDLLYEQNETVPLTMGGVTGIGTIVDNDTPTLSINDVIINEAAGTVTFTVTRAGDLTQAASVQYASANDSATSGAGNDYTAVAGTLNFAANVATQTITVSINNDTVFEGAESFNINLSNAVGAVITDSQGVGTIVDDGRTLPGGGTANDDRPVFNVGSDFIVDEAAGTITFTVTKTGSTNLASSVAFTTVDGSAAAGSDYTATAGTLTFAANETSKTITVPITNDTVFEGAETFSLQISTPTNATIGDNSQVATIVDDGRTLPGGGTSNDDRPSVSIGSNVVIDEAAGTVTFTVTKTGSTNLPVTVDFATANGSATAGSDYTAINGSLTFAANETTKTITVNITNDTTYEISEDFTVSLSNVSGATLGTSSATGTIVDDGRTLPGGGTANDDRPGFSINDVIINEAAGTVTFTVTRAGDLTQAASVQYASANDSATSGAGNDYTAVAGTLNFAANVATQTITVSINNDTVFEGAESFNINLSNAVGAVITDSQGVGTIRDDGTGTGGTDNDTPTLSVSSPTVAENAGFAQFTVSLNNASTTATSVNLALTNGSATGTGTDYGSATATNLQVSTDGGTTWSNATTATIAAGTTSVLVRTPITNDALDEVNENFTLTATRTAGTTTNASANGTATITDDDATPSLSVNDITVNEAAGTATFTVTLSAASGQTVTVGYNTSDGTATAGSDYTSTTGTLTFAPGVTTQTITVNIANDAPAIFEGAETFNVNLVTPTNATITDNLGVGTIRDDGTGTGGTDNDTPTLSVSSPTVAENAGFAQFTVSLNNASTTATSVNLALTNGSATGTGTDYGSATATNLQVSTDGGTTWSNATTATIAAGTTSVLVRTPITNDGLQKQTKPSHSLQPAPQAPLQMAAPQVTPLFWTMIIRPSQGMTPIR
uniref:Calx-beta domain-containing protein n=1 Tax=Curvibacter symbiont subsp. Hydra magnipapillata TaxID=667019 RepID=C9YDB2_CURXX|nr:hypothetical protein Csp_C26910 [Curvibacter putative symbiont of Hydra magnipapillata]